MGKIYVFYFRNLNTLWLLLKDPRHLISSPFMTLRHNIRFERILKQFISPKCVVYLCGAMGLASIYQSAGSVSEYYRDFYFFLIEIKIITFLCFQAEHMLEIHIFIYIIISNLEVQICIENFLLMIFWIWYYHAHLNRVMTMVAQVSDVASGLLAIAIYSHLF